MNQKEFEALDDEQEREKAFNEYPFYIILLHSSFLLFQFDGVVCMLHDLQRNKEQKKREEMQIVTKRKKKRKKKMKVGKRKMKRNANIERRNTNPNQRNTGIGMTRIERR